VLKAQHVTKIRRPAAVGSHAHLRLYWSIGPRAASPNFDLDALLHPARAFAHPRDVVADPDLTLNEKRAILASWASDPCAIDAAPDLRCAPGSEQSVSIDASLDALRDLDKALRSRLFSSSSSFRRLTCSIFSPPNS
jgi:hypothetical protein